MWWDQKAQGQLHGRHGVDQAVFLDPVQHVQVVAT